MSIKHISIYYLFYQVSLSPPLFSLSEKVNDKLNERQWDELQDLHRYVLYERGKYANYMQIRQ